MGIPIDSGSTGDARGSIMIGSTTAPIISNAFPAQVGEYAVPFVSDSAPTEPTLPLGFTAKDMGLTVVKNPDSTTTTYKIYELSVNALISNGLLPAQTGQFNVPFGIVPEVPLGFIIQDLGMSRAGDGEVYQLSEWDKLTKDERDKYNRLGF